MILFLPLQKPCDILHQFHHVLFFGDLNYRLNFGDQGNKETPSEATFKALLHEIESENFDELYVKSDQLRKQMEDRKVFIGFSDLQPKFKPTFKVERNALLTYKNQRSPAWCDRILFSCMKGYNLIPISFTGVNEIMTSDHKPIVATFVADIYELPCSIDDRVGACTIKIKNMSATGLVAADLSGTSDPYVIFLGSFFAEDSTKTRSQVLNAVHFSYFAFSSRL